MRLLVDYIYDAFREELREIEKDEDSLNETLQEIQAIREAARHQSPGALTISYEQRDEPFDE